MEIGIRPEMEPQLFHDTNSQFVQALAFNHVASTFSEWNIPRFRNARRRFLRLLTMPSRWRFLSVFGYLGK